MKIDHYLFRFLPLALVMFSSEMLISCGNDESQKSAAECVDDCYCKHDKICMPGCKIWAGGNATLYWGCSSDCSSLLDSCLSVCNNGGTPSWDGTGPFAGGGVDWESLKKNCK